MKIPLLLLAILLLLLTEGFFSGSEIAIVSSDRIKIKLLADQGVRRASLILKLLEKPERLLATTLIGTNISVISSSFAANELFATLFGRRYSGFAILFLVPLVLLFGETIPKSISRNNAEGIALISIYPLSAILVLLFPLVSLTGTFAMLFFGKDRILEKRKNPFVTREELKILLQSEKNLKERYETTFVNRIIDFAAAAVKDHMTPAFRIVSVPRDSKIIEVVCTIRESGFTRIPVYERERGNIIGLVDARDLLESKEDDETIESKIGKVLVIAEDERIQDLLKDFQKEGCHFAVVRNQQGEVTGIITIEDILEEIVGEIFDEFDKPPEKHSSL
ncbi:MAG: hemolysin family protein [Acidobacteriota bacterium]